MMDELTVYSGPKAAEYGTFQHGLAAAFVCACALLFGPTMEAATTHTDGDVTIRVDAETELGELYNFWSTSVQTIQQHFTDRANHQQIREQHPFAKYINCVRFLGDRYGRKDDFFRGVGDDGQALCDFSGALRTLRGIIECGFTPRIVLDNVPTAMSESKQLQEYGNTQPPKDFDLWHSYIRQFVEALVSEFGREQVSRWRFRVGTEPDLYPGHWSGTKEDYLKHYDYTVDAVTSVIPDADIGPGNTLPPLDNPRAKYPYERWGRDIIDHCATGTNYKTGKVGTRMRFFACSWYGHVGLGVDGFDADAEFDAAIEEIRERLSKYPQFANVPVEVQEFSILTDAEGKRLHAGDASEWAASWMADIADRVYRLGVAQVYQWATTSDGIANPRTHVLELLEKMAGGKRLAVEEPSAGKSGKIGCLAGAKDGGIDLLIYRHKPERDDGKPVNVRVVLGGGRVAKKGWRVVRGYLIDRDHSGYIRAFYKDAEAAGLEPLADAPMFAAIGTWWSEPRFGRKGQKLFNANREKYRKLGRLRELSPLPELSRDNSGGFSLPVVLAGHSVVYLRLERQSLSAACSGRKVRDRMEPQKINTDIIVNKTWMGQFKDTDSNYPLDKIRIIDVRNKAQYRLKHIPNAVWFDPILPKYPLDESNPNYDPGAVIKGSKFGQNLMPPDKIADLLSTLGISHNNPCTAYNDIDIVIYDDSSGLWASYIYWILEHSGYPDDKLHILNGGLNAWVDAGGSTVTDIPAVKKGTFTPDICRNDDSDKFAGKSLVRDIAQGRVEGVLLDVRAPYDPETNKGEYSEEDKWPGFDASLKKGVAATIGRIPGAVNINYSRAIKDKWDNDGDGKLDNGVWPLETNIYANISRDALIVTYCHGGVRAAHTYVTLKALGYTTVRVYEGSWSDWGYEKSY